MITWYDTPKGVLSSEQYNDSQFIALKIQLPTEQIKNATKEALLNYEISNTRKPGFKNPLIPITYDAYFIRPSDDIYENTIKI